MKRCDRCSNEATHYYRIQINGQAREVHLCARCAAEERRNDEASLFFFVPKVTRRSAPAASAATESPSDPLPPQSEKSLATLKAQLKRALRREDYLTAARLRDSIRTLEGK